ncbi:MAG TPA: transcriptional regulator [Firmicutes bacterium]|nr:transcriptional regulator [Bacillota bacterium]
MEITEVRIKKLESTNRVKGIASITINNCFVVNDIKILESQNELFIGMPSRRTPNGEFKDIAHPINAETRKVIQNAILKEYEKID